MDDIQDNILEYRISCAKLEMRIHQLNAQISRCEKDGFPSKELLDRRYLLYTELADLKQQVLLMEEYLECTGRQPLKHAV